MARRRIDGGFRKLRGSDREGALSELMGPEASWLTDFVVFVVVGIAIMLALPVVGVRSDLARMAIAFPLGTWRWLALGCYQEAGSGEALTGMVDGPRNPMKANRGLRLRACA